MDWIPLQIAAKAVVDFRLATGPESSTIVHLVHPRPTSWSSLSKIIAADLGVELVPFAAWLISLEELGKSYVDEVEAMRNIPALRLLSFFESISTQPTGSIAGLGFRRLDSRLSLDLSRTLSDPNVPQLGESDVKAWLGYWKSVGFISEWR